MLPLKWNPPAPSSEPSCSAGTSPAERQYDEKHLHSQRGECEYCAHRKTTLTYLYYLCPRADANSMGNTPLCHLVHKHSGLIASDHFQLAEQRLPLEGDGEDTAVDPNSFWA